MRGYVRSTGAYGRYGRGGELKFFDTAISDNIDLTGHVPATGGQLNLVPQGTQESQRIGRKIIIRSLRLRFVSRITSAALVGGAGTVTIFVVQDKQTNGAAASVTSVLTGTNTTTDMPNLNEVNRFNILKKFTFTLNSTAGIAGAYQLGQKSFDFYKKCNIPIEFDSTTGAITEIRSNNLFLLVGVQEAAADDLINIVGTARIRYTD